MSRFNLDKYILGIGGLTVENGITDYHIEETNLRRVMLERSQKVIGLTDYSKFGVIAMNEVWPPVQAGRADHRQPGGSDDHRKKCTQ